ncbi:MAG TPA: glycoside hydrolase family 2 TIM barrel-domain containing protein, partial [Hanamia sp.]
LRPSDGFYVNGVKVIFKGVNRHSAWPESGRTLSKEISINDVKLMKEMNMNAVRMSHYPPDQHFLDVCDSLGLFVLNELTGWQAAYDTEIGRKRVKELVERDVNHPSIVLWANGNEGGWNRDLDNDFQLYDPQQRKVYHPDEKFNGTDTKHYPIYNYVVNSSLYSKEVFFPTEFMHGLYDGGHGAGLKDYWDLMEKHPYNAGAFLWVFADEGMERSDKNGWIDTDGNHAPDGILGPYREKEASFYTIKEVWSPVVIEQTYIDSNFNGSLSIENKYLYTNLDQCTFQWKLVSFPLPKEASANYKIDTEGTLATYSLPPGEKGFINLNLPEGWKNSNALYFTAIDKNQQELFTWSWPISSVEQTTRNILSRRAHHPAKVIANERGEHLILQNGEVSTFFNTKTGFLDKVISQEVPISLSGGPLMASSALSLKSFKHYAANDNYVVEVAYEGEGKMNLKWTFSAGNPVQLDYEYTQVGEADYIGITMNYPEEKITGMKWLGRGPYRVWKNRTEGLQFNVWHKEYNNTVTGESWQYPEFKGYHSNLYWVTIENKEKPFTIYSSTENIFLQMLKAEKPKGASNDFTSPPFPSGNLGFMYAIPPIGTKFQEAYKLGPRSQKNMQLNNSPITGTLWFDFD